MESSKPSPPSGLGLARIGGSSPVYNTSDPSQQNKGKGTRSLRFAFSRGRVNQAGCRKRNKGLAFVVCRRLR